MANAVSCAYDISGNGPALFMVHGIGARRQLWAPIVDALSSSFTCIQYDLRGHGDSPSGNGTMTLDDLVADLEALRLKLGIEQAHIIGHSLGGMIGPAYAKAHPDKVLSLGLLSTAAFRTEEDSKRVKAVVAKMREEGIAPNLQTLTLRWFSDAFAKANPDVIAKRSQQVLDTPPEVFLNVFDIYASTEMSPWLQDVEAPSLVLTGAEDGGCPPRLNEQIANALPNSELVILEQLKHAILLEGPDLVIEHLKHFYQTHFQI